MRTLVLHVTRSVMQAISTTEPPHQVKVLMRSCHAKAVRQIVATGGRVVCKLITPPKMESSKRIKPVAPEEHSYIVTFGFNKPRLEFHTKATSAKHARSIAHHHVVEVCKMNIFAAYRRK